MSTKPMTITVRVGQAKLAVDRIDPIQPGGDPFIFQHGMGGDSSQPTGYLHGQDQSCTVVAINARGHGASSDAHPADCRFDRFADDVIAVADALGIARFIAGGISMGAGTAINLVVRYPQRVSALVLCRPAWRDEPQGLWNREVYRQIADILDTSFLDTTPPTVHRDDPTAADPPRTDDVAQRALAQFCQTPTYAQVLAAAPGAAASLRHQITRPGAAANPSVLRCMPADRPTVSRVGWAAITVPALVIGHHDDPFHPYPIAELYARSIPTATLTTVPSKDASPDGFAGQIGEALTRFLHHQAAST